MAALMICDFFDINLLLHTVWMAALFLLSTAPYGVLPKLPEKRSSQARLKRTAFSHRPPLFFTWQGWPLVASALSSDLYAEGERTERGRRR